MGPYCRYCDHRCFVERVLPGSTETINLATCLRGRTNDRYKTGGWHAGNTLAPGWHTPALCIATRRTFDLGHVEVTARYADCSRFACPCCHKMHDDRLGGIGGVRRIDLAAYRAGRQPEHTGAPTGAQWVTGSIQGYLL